MYLPLEIVLFVHYQPLLMLRGIIRLIVQEFCTEQYRAVKCRQIRGFTVGGLLLPVPICLYCPSLTFKQ